VLTGVVVAKENEDTVIDAWEEEMERQRLKEVIKCIGEPSIGFFVADFIWVRFRVVTSLV